MAERWCVIVAAALVIWGALHLLLALWFRRWMADQRRRAGGAQPGDPAPRVSVLVAARGFDEGVAAVLDGLARQSYPDYEVLVAADAWRALKELPPRGWQTVEWDPAELESVGGEAAFTCWRLGPGPRMTVVDDWPRFFECGRKCSALLALLPVVSPGSHYLAMLDVDIEPGPDWLAGLVAALAARPDCGAATGVQWFEPRGWFGGGMVRSLWNAAALFPSALLANPWAGSMILRKEAFESSGLAKRWSRSIVDDGPVRGALGGIGLGVCLAPQVTMTNVLPCTVAQSWNWLSRMVKWSRLYEGSFAGTLVAALATLLLIAASAVAGTAALVGGGWGWLLLLGGWVAAGQLMLGGWMVMRSAARTDARISPRTPAGGPGWGLVLRAVWLIPWTQALFFLATLRALAGRRYRWSGVEYDLAADGRVLAARDRP